jgi:membrane protease YdiL (CAAX protease family)
MVRAMPQALRSDAFKIVMYFAAVLLLGSLLAPWLYAGGKDLAAHFAGKPDKGFLPWLAAACDRSKFPRFYNRSLMLSAIVLLYPAILWLRAGRGSLKFRDTPWSLRLPDSTVALNEGQPLRRNPEGWRQLTIGFVLAVATLLLLGWGLVQAGTFDHAPKINLPKILKAAIVPAVLVSLIEEILFRGVFLGMFLRAMRPAPAIVGLSLLFAFLHFLEPPSGVTAPDPRSATAGLWLLGQILGHFADPQPLLAEFATLAAVGLVLAYARWRTASLWLSIGLHSGWIFGIFLFNGFTRPAPGLGRFTRFWIGDTLREGLAPLIVVLLTGVFVHLLTRRDVARIAN